MSSQDPKHEAKNEAEKEPDQEERIRQLETRIAELGGSPHFEDEDLDPVLKETFLRNIVEMEEAGWNRPADLLQEGGIEITPSDQVSDEDLPETLRDLVHAMALNNMYLECTDHLSDRELYTVLVEDHLANETMLGPRKPVKGYNFIIDMLGSGSDEHAAMLLRYYLEGEMRERWIADLPGEEIPEKEDPPYDRDRFLPKPDWTPVDWDEDEPVM